MSFSWLIGKADTMAEYSERPFCVRRDGGGAYYYYVFTRLENQVWTRSVCRFYFLKHRRRTIDSGLPINISRRSIMWHWYDKKRIWAFSTLNDREVQGNRQNL